MLSNCTLYRLFKDSIWAAANDNSSLYFLEASIEFALDDIFLAAPSKFLMLSPKLAINSPSILASFNNSSNFLDNNPCGLSFLSFLLVSPPASSGYTKDQSNSLSTGSNADNAKITASVTRPNVNIALPVMGPNSI